MIIPILKDTQTGAFAYSTNMTGVDVQQAKGVCVLTQVTVDTPSAGAFTAAVTDICTKTAHTMRTGLKVQVSTTGALPAGLSASTDYFVIYLTANTFSLATTLANAIAGTAIDITDTGTGTHTITPTALAGATVKLQGSIDGSAYADMPITGTGDVTVTEPITASGNLLLNHVDPMVNYMRAVYTLTAGQMTITQTMEVKGMV